MTLSDEYGSLILANSSNNNKTKCNKTAQQVLDRTLNNHIRTEKDNINAQQPFNRVWSLRKDTTAARVFEQGTLTNLSTISLVPPNQFAKPTQILPISSRPPITNHTSIAITPKVLQHRHHPTNLKHTKYEILKQIPQRLKPFNQAID